MLKYRMMSRIVALGIFRWRKYVIYVFFSKPLYTSAFSVKLRNDSFNRISFGSLVWTESIAEIFD